MRFATEQDIPRLIAFLGQAMVGAENVASLVGQFLIYEDEQGEIQATIGYERSQTDALLRSLVLRPAMNPMHILALLQALLQSLQQKGMTSVYMIAKRKSDLPLFHMFGFQHVEKVPKHITEMEHFKKNVDTDCIILNCQLFTMLSTVL